MIFGYAAAMCLGCICFPQPFMHAYSSRTANGFKAMVLSFGGLCVLLITCTTLVGVAATLLVPGLKGVEADKVYGLAAAQVLPTALAALAVAGGFTAAMSTVNGLVFGNAMNIANDVYKLWRPRATSGELVAVARISVVGLLGAATVIALDPKTPVAELSVIAFGIIAVTVFPLWGAYFWKRATRWGAVAATVVGVGTNLALFAVGGRGMVLNPNPAWFQLNGFLVSFVAAGVVFFAVSLLTRPGAKEQESLPVFFHASL
jgi:SSS family solute:Na+ symporter